MFGPYQNKIDGQASLILARSLRHPDGSFAGVAGAIIPVRALQGLLGAVDVGTSGRTGLRDERLGMLAPPSGPPRSAGELARIGTVSAELRAAVVARPAEGTVRAFSGIDNVDRMTAYRRLPKYPLYVLVGLATSDFLAPWKVMAAWAAGFFLVFAGASFVVVRLVHSGLERQARVRTLLAQVTASEDHLRSLYETTPAMLHAIDLDGRLIMVSDTWLARLGYRREEVIGRKSVEFLTEASRHFVLTEGLPGLMKSGRQDDLELQMLHRSGEVVDVLLTATVDTTAVGQPPRIVAGIRDVTLRRRAEKALRDERERLKNIIEGTRAGTWEHNLVTGEDAVNTNYVDMLGYSHDEYRLQTQTSFLDLVHPDDREAVQTLNQQRLAGGTQAFEAEFRMHHKDGHWIWVLSRGSVFLRDAAGAPIALSGIHLDITARKDAERQLARERKQLANILEGTNVGTWEWNLETGQCKFNERWAGIAGYNLEELGEHRIETSTSLVHPDDLTASAVLLERHFNGELPYYDAELRVRHKDGHWVWVLERGKLFSRSDDGRPRWMAGTRLDITKRKVAEQAQRDFSERFELAAESAGIGVWEFDPQTGEVQWDDRMFRLHGRDRSEGQEPRNLWQATVHPEDLPMVTNAIRRALKSDQPDTEFRIVCPDGTIRYLRAYARAIRRADGHATRVIGVSFDVTQRRALEAELRSKNEVMSNILENLPCGLSVFNNDLELVASNTQYRRLLDFPASLFESPTPHFADFIRFNAERGEYGDGDIGPMVRSIVERACSPAVAHRFERIRPNGLPLEIQGAPMPGGGFVTTYTDISERRQAEQALQQRERLMRLVIDSFPGPLAHWDTEMRCTIANRAYLAWMGLDPEQMIGRTQRELIGDEVYARNEPHILAALRGEDQRVERSRVIADGSARHYFLHYLPDRDGEQIRGFISVVVDVSEMKQVQLQLQERTTQAEQASVAKSQFLANMSHEIRTPMNAILGMLALLKKTNLSSRQADYADKTEGAARSLLGLLNDILDFSKVEAGKMVLDPQPFRVDWLMRDLSVILAANVSGKDIEVLFDVDPSVPRQLVGDAMRLQQVLINLGGNAIKFTPSGAVVVSVERVASSDDEVTLEIGVRDSGIGIAPEHRERIFSGFTQAEASTTRRFGGTGLGLAICQRLVALMGGTLRLESEVGVGSRFFFQVTLRRTVGPGEAEVVEAAGTAPEPMHVLIVDDHPLARAIGQRTAQSLGWLADAADSGMGALDAVRHAARPYDVVFLDWQMPQMDGWQTARAIREATVAAKRPTLIMVTAHGRESLAARSPEEQALVDGFVVKPATASMLADAVAEAHGTATATAGARLSAAQAPSARLAGLRLLVAEDNANNQQIARELLEDEGAEIVIAGNGLEALQAIQAAQPSFDAVLMDLQMPVMDGYTATSRIRQEFDGKTLPIVAMTANAMASDREACLAAGMNDHVGKPFDLDHLVAVLRRLAGRGDGAVPASAGTAVSAVVQEAASQAGVDIGAAIRRLGGNLRVYRRSLRDFAQELVASSLRIRASAEGGRWDDASRELHTVKGVAATVGAVVLAGHAASAEAALKTGVSTDSARKAVAEATALLEAATPTLTALCAALEADAGDTAAEAVASPAVLTKPEKDMLATLLGAISSMLAASDLEAIEALKALRKTLPVAAGPRLDALQETVDSLDFDAARTCCDDWLKDFSS